MFELWVRKHLNKLNGRTRMFLVNGCVNWPGNQGTADVTAESTVMGTALLSGCGSSPISVDLVQDSIYKQSKYFLRRSPDSNCPHPSNRVLYKRRTSIYAYRQDNYPTANMGIIEDSAVLRED
jgi:hypothetical protein